MKILLKTNSLRYAIIGAFAIIGGGSTFARISKEALDAIAMPDKVETAIGELKFFDGVPNDATIDKLYDNLDRMRGVQAYLDNQGAASLYAMRMGNAGIGGTANTVTITEQLLKPESLDLTDNTSTLYALTYLDLKVDGPLVVELPPGMLDTSKHNYTFTFVKGEMPPVNAFWSVTMYYGKSQLMVENPINRYLVNTAMTSDMKEKEDGSVTIYVQKDSPGKDKESNWLPAPNETAYMVMRLYWPKPATEKLSVLPVGKGTWKPPGVVKSN